MPIILMKLITNKYVIIGLLALSLFAYVKHLNTSLSESRKQASQAAQTANLLFFENERLLKEKQKVEKVLSARSRDISVIKEKSCDRKLTIDLVAKQNEALEKVNEKDILGSELPSSVVDTLGLSDKPQGN